MKRGADFFFHSEVWYRICKQKNKEREREYKLNWIYRNELLFCADGIKLLGDDLSATKTNTDGLECDKKVRFEVNTEKSKYLIMVCH